jgi:phosphatidylglycerol:prolipoprotein diacylglycerol transferase
MGAGFFPPLSYIIINVDPIAVRLGPIAIHWYGLAYVVAISIGLIVLFRWTRKMGIHQDQIWSLFFSIAIAALLGARLYFVIQQPDLVQNYLLNPINIIAVWNGGLAFFGAIFGGILALAVLAPRYGLSRWIAIDGGALFAAVGQIFGRFGNIVNGDITGYALTKGPIQLPPGVCTSSPCISYVSDPHILPWAFVYAHPDSFAKQFIPLQPAPVYEMIVNLIALALLWPLRERLPRLKAGYFFVLYLAFYAIGQFVVFFYRGSEPATPFLGISGLRQAQWTAIFVFIACIPLFLIIRRYSTPWTYTEEHPTAWPPVGAGPSPAVSLKQAAAARATNSAGSTKVAAQPAEPITNLPPWQPGSSSGGALRNQLGH